MLTEKQFGFKKGESCVTNILIYYESMTKTTQEREGLAESKYLDF